MVEAGEACDTNSGTGSDNGCKDQLSCAHPGADASKNVCCEEGSCKDVAWTADWGMTDHWCAKTPAGGKCKYDCQCLNHFCSSEGVCGTVQVAALIADMYAAIVGHVVSDTHTRNRVALSQLVNINNTHVPAMLCCHTAVQSANVSVGSVADALLSKGFRQTFREAVDKVVRNVGDRVGSLRQDRERYYRRDQHFAQPSLLGAEHCHLGSHPEPKHDVPHRQRPNVRPHVLLRLGRKGMQGRESNVQVVWN